MNIHTRVGTELKSLLLVGGRKGQLVEFYELYVEWVQVASRILKHFFSPLKLSSSRYHCVLLVFYFLFLLFLRCNVAQKYT